MEVCLALLLLHRRAHPTGSCCPFSPSTPTNILPFDLFASVPQIHTSHAIKNPVLGPEGRLILSFVHTLSHLRWNAVVLHLGIGLHTIHILIALRASQQHVYHVAFPSRNLRLPIGGG